MCSGGKLNPQGSARRPRISLANSPVSPVDRVAFVDGTVQRGGQTQTIFKPRSILASGAPNGGNNSTRTSGNSENDFSIIGRTSRQFSPPSPHPSGGTAIERMPSRRTSSMSDFSPDRISSIRESVSPVPLGREVDDVPRFDELAIVEGEHASWHDLMRPARRFISLEVRRKSLLELKCQAFSHNANAVHGVHQRLGVGFQDVAMGDFNHGAAL